MDSFIKIMQERRAKNQRVITEKEFLDAENREKQLEDIEKEHEEKDSN